MEDKEVKNSTAREREGKKILSACDHENSTMKWKNIFDRK